MTFIVSEAARADLIRIYFDGRDMFGEAQANKFHHELEQLFSLIADNPRIAREREELRQPVRGHPHKRHIIFYSIEQDDTIVVRRIRHASEDWIGDMEEGGHA